MQQPSMLMLLLQVLDNLYVVSFCVLVVVGVRLLWVRHQRKQQQRAEIANTETGRRGKRENSAAVTAAEAPKKKKDYTLEVIDTLLIALILVFGIVRPFLLQTFFIPSGSMEPTLLVDDKLIANKLVYHVRPPARGQVIVFRPPVEAIVGNSRPLFTYQWLAENRGTLSDNEAEYLRQGMVIYMQRLGLDPATLETKGPVQSEDGLRRRLSEFPIRQDDYIKRVIGVPGDRIRLVKDVGVYVNGTLLDEPYLPAGESPTSMQFPEIPDAPGPQPHLRPTMTVEETQVEVNRYVGEMIEWLEKWARHDYLYTRRIQPHVDNGEFVVPEGAVFVMGDNRSPTGSFDSRYWGIVPQKDVKARAVSTFWPLTRLKLL